MSEGQINLVEFITQEVYVTTWDYSKWLVGSSLFFLVPAIFAYVHHLYFYACAIFLMSIISINFWRKATYSWRRNLDICCASVGSIVLVILGVLYIKPLHSLMWYLLLFTLFYSFYLSCKLFELKNTHWYKYHIFFHFSAMTILLIILNRMKVKEWIEEHSPTLS